MRNARTLTALVALLGLALVAGPAAAKQPGWSDVPGGSPTAIVEGAPGDPEMVNFEHVFNFNFQNHLPRNANDQGTDIEFFTSTVPLRDYQEGGLFIDENGEYLIPGEEPILAERDFAIVGSYDRGGFVFDITDPEEPQFVRLIPCNQQQNDVQLKLFDERWILALARDGGTTPCVSTGKNIGGPNGGIAVFDVTDPFEFEPLYNVRVVGGAHNFTFHPTKPFGWVSTGDLPGAANLNTPGSNHILIIDFTDVDNPVIAADIEVSAGGPHDITFSQDGQRAFVANENHGEIYDVTSPAAPELIGVTPNVGTYSHGFDPNPDRSIAVQTNESLALGGFFASGTGVCPGEGLIFHDVSGANEEAPVPLGYFLAEDLQGKTPDHRACTGHVGKVGNDVLTTGWYIGGVRVVDFSDPSAPTEIGRAVMPGTEVWSAKFHKGPYVFTGDLGRGFDVFRWTGSSPAPWEEPEEEPAA
jgi:hypothetical protein